MKTIVENSTGISKFVLEDSTVVVMQDSQIVIGDPVQFVVACHNQNDSTLHENVTTVPADWSGNKYFFDGTTWTLNPDWIDPATLEN